jgi:hypothetical protein
MGSCMGGCGICNGEDDVASRRGFCMRPLFFFFFFPDYFELTYH